MARQCDDTAIGNYKLVVHGTGDPNRFGFSHEPAGIFLYNRDGAVFAQVHARTEDPLPLDQKDTSGIVHMYIPLGALQYLTGVLLSQPDVFLEWIWYDEDVQAGHPTPGLTQIQTGRIDLVRRVEGRPK